MTKKISLILFAPIINNFDFYSDEKNFFISSRELNKIFLEKKLAGTSQSDELLNLFKVDHNKELSEIIKQKNQPNLILINYPHTEKDFKSFNQELVAEGQKIENIILLNITNYELISSIQSQYLLCPLCEKIYSKKETIKENEKFVCPLDKDYQFTLKEIIKFNELIISHYLKNSKELIESFLREKNSFSGLVQLTVDKETEIFSGETQKKLLSIIRNL